MPLGKKDVHCINLTKKREIHLAVIWCCLHTLPLLKCFSRLDATCSHVSSQQFECCQSRTYSCLLAELFDPIKVPLPYDRSLRRIFSGLMRGTVIGAQENSTIL